MILFVNEGHDIIYGQFSQVWCSGCSAGSVSRRPQVPFPARRPEYDSLSVCLLIAYRGGWSFTCGRRLTPLGVLEVTKKIGD